MAKINRALLVATLATLASCHADPPADVANTMTTPPRLEEIIGNDATSRAKAEEVYFRCTQSPREKRAIDPWCQLREQASIARKQRAASRPHTR